MSHLESFFDALSDDELLSRIRSGALTEEALPIALAEARRRGFGDVSSTPTEEALDQPHEGDMAKLEGDLSPQEAQVIASLLQSAGIPAFAADTNLVQANSLLAFAVGGCRVLVPESRLLEARELLSAMRRGDFDLGEDFEGDDAAAYPPLKPQPPATA